MCLHLLWLFTRYSISLTSVAEGLPSWTAALIICRLSCKQNSIDSAILGKLILAHPANKKSRPKNPLKMAFFTTKASKTASRSHKKRTQTQKKKISKIGFLECFVSTPGGLHVSLTIFWSPIPARTSLFMTSFGAYRSEVMLFIFIIYSISFMHFSMLVSTRKFD